MRESVSRPALDYSEGMTSEEQKRYINYLAERAVRPLTTRRNAMLYFGSDERAEYLPQHHQYGEDARTVCLRVYR